MCVEHYKITNCYLWLHMQLVGLNIVEATYKCSALSVCYTVSYYKKINNNPHMFANMQQCWQHYITHPHCQPVGPISACVFK